MDRTFSEVRSYLVTRIETLETQDNAANTGELRAMLHWLDRWGLMEELADDDVASADADDA